jgi:hypothetical protein
VFHRPNPKLDLDLPSPLMEQINYEAKLLGVLFSSNWHADAYINI